MLQQSNVDCYTLRAETFMSHRFEIAQKFEALGKKALLIAPNILYNTRNTRRDADTVSLHQPPKDPSTYLSECLT